MAGLGPTREQFARFAAATDDGPVVMINLLKYRDRAAGDDASGRDAYDRYLDAIAPLAQGRGGRTVFRGPVQQVLVGGDGDDWDEALLVEYPSRKAFIDMVSSDEYRAAAAHRDAALERTVILVARAVQG